MACGFSRGRGSLKDRGFKGSQKGDPAGPPWDQDHRPVGLLHRLDLLTVEVGLGIIGIKLDPIKEGFYALESLVGTSV